MQFVCRHHCYSYSWRILWPYVDFSWTGSIGELFVSERYGIFLTLITKSAAAATSSGWIILDLSRPWLSGIIGVFTNPGSIEHTLIPLVLTLSNNASVKPVTPYLEAVSAEMNTLFLHNKKLLHNEVEI